MSNTYLYLSGSDVIEVVLRDCTGRKIETYRASSNDKIALRKMLQSVINKYGHSLKVSDDNSKIDWLKADEEFKF